MDDVSHGFEIKSELSKPYLNIKPEEYMSDRDLADFIRNEFEVSNDVVEYDTYDKLLSEVFNRSESEISIDFNITDKIRSLLEGFRPDKWESLEDNERLNLIDEFSKVISDELGLNDAPIINISENNDSYGCYDRQNNTITLNRLYLSDSIELVNTIAHELRHAYQHMRADILETREDALFRVNYENYVSAIQLPEGGWLFFMDYYNQYVEVDARAFADKFTEAML